MKSFWFKKGKGRAYVGKYEYDKHGERVFQLLSTSGPYRRVTFESAAAAKKVGWVLVRK